MSLRDQLLAKGLVSKADKARVERELKTQRKIEQGERKAAAEVSAEADRNRSEEAARELEKRRTERLERDAAAATREREHQLRQLVHKNRLGWRGPVPYHYREPASSRLRRIGVLPGVAERLRRGEAAIVADPDELGRHLVVQPRAARRLRDLDAGHLVIVFHADSTGLSDPAEAVVKQPEERDWDRRPHRVRQQSDKEPETKRSEDP